MNTTPCPDCAEAVSRNARLCPHCGAPGPARRRARQLARRLLFAVALLLTLWAAVAFYNYRVEQMTRSLGGIEMPDVSIRR